MFLVSGRHNSLADQSQSFRKPGTKDLTTYKDSVQRKLAPRLDLGNLVKDQVVMQG